MVWRIRDEVDGQREKAVLRWRLAPDDWALEGTTLSGTLATLAIEADRTPERVRLVDGKESRYYFELDTIPVLEVELGPEARWVETVITLLSPHNTASKGRKSLNGSAADTA